MADTVGELNVEITGDASGLTDAIDQAKSSLSGLSDIMGGVFAADSLQSFVGMAGNISNMFTGLGSSIMSNADSYESVTTSIGNLLGNVSTYGSTATSALSSVGGKASLVGMQMQDEIIAYQEKVQKFNDEIADVTKAENVITAQQDVNTKLEDLAQSHADKIESINDEVDQSNQNLLERQQERVQKMNDSIADMQASHDDNLADKKEKLQSQINAASTQSQKTWLQAQFDAQQKLEEDSYQRKLATKKAQLQRTMDEENAKDKQTTDQHIQALQDRIAKENEQYNKQEEKLKNDSAKKIEQLQDENAKKLALYKKELGDEERAHKEHMARLQNEAASGGGRGKSKETLPLSQNDPFSVFSKESAKSREELLTWLDKFSSQTPYTFQQLSRGALQLTAFKLNAKELIPIIGDMSAGMGKDLATGVQAVTDAMEGRPMMLKQELDIDREELVKFGAQFDATGHLIDQGSFFKALERIRNSQFHNSMKVQMNTVNGALSNLQDSFFRFSMAFIGFNIDTGKAVKGGLFEMLETQIVGLSQYLNTHQGEIKSFFTEMGADLKDILKVVIPIVGAIGDFIIHHKQLVATIVIGIGIFAALIPIIAAVGGIIALVAAGPIGLITIGIIVLTAKVAWMAASFITSLQDIKQQWSSFANFIGGVVDKIKGFLGDMAKHAKDALSHLDPFARHSPSLVEQVTSGVSVIKGQYMSLGQMQMPQMSAVPVMGGGGGGGGGLQSSTVQNNSTNVMMNNVFNVQGQANASNAAAFIAYQLEQKGVV